ncbi:MAG TPA: hypothetical protein VEQ63_12970, partial [Bryobacteraceae bacterium]|nr:hypothetical protein [Bryobacteraceae bacterium]
MHEAVRTFLATASRPAAIEPGELPIQLQSGNYSLEVAGGRLTLHAWDRDRNVVRRIRAIKSATPIRLQLEVERFGKKPGLLDIVDMQKPSAHSVGKRAMRSHARERLRRSLMRQYPGWQVEELSSEADLEHSLSPAYPRGLIKRGKVAWAAIVAPEEAIDVDGVLSFGLIWLNYVRQRERKLTVEGLALFVPEGRQQNTCLRLLHLDPSVANYKVFIYGEGFEDAVDLKDHGNVDSNLPVSPLSRPIPHWLQELAVEPGVETVVGPEGLVQFRVNGLEFANWDGARLRCGIETQRSASASTVRDAKYVANELRRLRSSEAADRNNALFLRNPEAWLESCIRRRIAEVDAGLLTAPVHGQVPAVLTGQRGVIDLL